MRFVADLHIHSHYSISTSRELTPPHLEAWARRKGVEVVGTGDATHPGWLAELKESLEPAEEGLYRLKAEAAAEAPRGPAASAPRFLLSAEVCTIYRRGDRTRKVHHLVLLPGFAAAEALQRRLERVGNLASDGRPVLGLDAQRLLEIVLESCPGACFIPAHIWTPWFSALGDKSGFDSIEECYGGLASEIYAVETGLSSDPPMNWACGFLDRFALVSNSDAHSPEKLGREANLFDCELSYGGIIGALKAAAIAAGAPGPGAPPSRNSGGPASGSFLGTIEFFPQEGKYHYDGHRRCGVRWEPRQTLEKGGLCPVCGKPVTIGVLNRVAQLATRPLEQRAGSAPAGSRRDTGARAPAGAQAADTEAGSRPGYRPLIPLKEILAEIAGVSAQSRQVSRRYDELLARGMTELDLLLERPVAELALLGGEALGEAVRRMRAGEVRVEPGYDGEYGRITLFDPGETRELGAQVLLFGRRQRSAPREGAGGARAGADFQAFRAGRRPAGPAAEPPPPASRTGPAGAQRLNPEQRRAVEHGAGPALVLAGPGTGKTSVLTARIAHLVRAGRVEPQGIVAVTFTNRAAREMRERLGLLLPDPRVREGIRVGTFHAFGLALLKSFGERLDLRWPFTIVNPQEREELLAALPACPQGKAAALAEALSLAKQAEGEQVPGELEELATQYEATLAMHNAVDLDDLLRLPVRLLASQPAVLEEARSRTLSLLIDEYQDVNAVQYRLVRLLLPAADAPLFAIGDPNQAIYGFRGADSRFLARFLEDYPGASVYGLKSSYRCSSTILKASAAVLGPGEGGAARPAARAGRPMEIQARLRISEHSSEAAEAEHVARTIEGLMGGTRFFSLDSAISAGVQQSGIRSFADIAVLCRVARQMEPLARALAGHAIPYQTASEQPWLRQEPVRSILRILQALRAPGNTLARERVLQERLASPQDLQRWREGFERDGDLTGLLAVLADGFPGADAARAGLARLAAEAGGGIDGFLELALLGTEPDALVREAERVSLLTLHAAKGLEYPCVFITGCEDGLLPYTLPARRPADLQEERRLFYVGMTRAGTYLYLSHARRRRLFGRELHLAPSPFLAGLGEELAERLRPDPPAPPPERAAEQLDLF